MGKASFSLVAKTCSRARRATSLQSILMLVRVEWADGDTTLEEFEDVQSMFSEEVVAWLDDHHPKVLTAEVAGRWGLADSDGVCLQYTDENSLEWPVAGVLLASGNVNGWEKGCYYVSDRRYGGPETFWKAPFFSISSFQSTQLKRHHADTCRYDFRTNPDSTITVNVTPETRAAFLESVDEWCLEHLDQVYDLTASGARKASTESQKSGLLTVHPIYCKTDSVCVLASIINMLFVEEGPTLACAMLDHGLPELSRNIGTFNTWLEGTLAKIRKTHGLSRTYSLGIPREDDVPSLTEPTEFIANTKAGKYIVRLGGLDDKFEEIDHTVYVDADRQLVFDGMEERALRLCYRALECCVGDAFLVGVKDIRIVITTQHGHYHPRSLQVISKGINISTPG